MARNWVCVAGYVHDTNKEEKTPKSNARSPDKESENHKTSAISCDAMLWWY